MCLFGCFCDEVCCWLAIFLSGCFCDEICCWLAGHVSPGCFFDEVCSWVAISLLGSSAARSGAGRQMVAGHVPVWLLLRRSL
jgi:hypothetical protein